MKVVHLDEDAARKALEGCEAALSFLAAAEGLTGHDDWNVTSHKLRAGVAVLREELGLSQFGVSAGMSS